MHHRRQLRPRRQAGAFKVVRTVVPLHRRTCNGGSRGDSPSEGRQRILAVDDPSEMLNGLASLLSDGYAVTAVQSPCQVPAHLDGSVADLVLTGLRMDALMNGGSAARLVEARRPRAPLIVYTRVGSATGQARAKQAGACDYVVLPGQPYDALIVRNAARTALDGLRLWQPTTGCPAAPDHVIAASREMQEVIRDVHHMAAEDRTVLILGETGTGKELVARALHAGSPRERRPFVPVNCGALAAGLAEAEFFGSVKGAYTGSHEDRRGLLEGR